MWCIKEVVSSLLLSSSLLDEIERTLRPCGGTPLRLDPSSMEGEYDKQKYRDNHALKARNHSSLTIDRQTDGSMV